MTKETIMRVLIVDDDYVSRSKVKALLRSHADCDAVPDGELALRMFEKAHEERVPYDLITMDIDMPGMNGKDVVQKIREWERRHEVYKARKEAKILMVTVRKDPEEIVVSFREGCEWYLIKPVTPESLQKALERLEFPIAT